jgi:arginyl-tRNA synthetase
VAFQLAKERKTSPVEIAKKLKEVIEIPSIFNRVENKGPYLNFYLDYKQFSKLLLSYVDENYGTLENRSKKIILEHTSANPNGPLHIGHIRNAIIGDSLARVLRAAGFEVETQYYVNDMGRQIAMIVWGLLNLDYEINADDKPDVIIGKLYLKVNQEFNANSEIKSEIDLILKNYEENGSTKIEKKFKNVVISCLEGVRTTCRRLHIRHDSFIWESSFVRNGSIQRIFKALERYSNQNEVLYLDLEDYGVEKELILTRSDGTSLYSTRDLAYHYWKSENADKVVDVLGSDHKLAIDQLSIALELLGSKIPDVIFYEFITLPEGSMSTRRGIFISVDELMDEAVKRAMHELEMRRPELIESEILGIGAIRYYIARLSPEKHIVFKWDEALSFERGCASIQYAHARACKLLEKISKFDRSLAITENSFDDLDPLEIELIKAIARFTSVIEVSSSEMRVHPVAQYAMELAGAFNKFYKSIPVIGSDKELFRLNLVDKSRITLRNCLNLLGIDAPVSM